MWRDDENVRLKSRYCQGRYLLNVIEAVVPLVLSAVWSVHGTHFLNESG